jgi:hypothetical protein
MFVSIYYLMSVDPVVTMAGHHSSFSRQSQAVMSNATAKRKSRGTGIGSTVTVTDAAKDKSSGEPLLSPHPLIPNILIFTHSINLLTNNNNNNNNTSADSELQALASNVRHSLQLHPDASVRFFTNEDCEQAIVRVFGDDKEKKRRLLEYFRKETEGMFKGDLCRGVALYETGGIYLDVDLGVRMRLWNAIDNATSFATIRVHGQSANPGAFFQAFIAVAPRHAILLRYIELFEEYYQGKLPQFKKKPLGVVLLKRAYDEVLAEQPALKESVEIWQEVLYRFDLQNTLLKHVPPPTWGTRRACKFIVVSSTNEPLTVPFYSRIAHSRMCPVNGK